MTIASLTVLLILFSYANGEYDDYATITLTYKLDGVSNKVQTQAPCFANDPSFKVVKELKTAAEELAKSFASDRLLTKMKNPKISYDIYLLNNQEITYSKKTLNEVVISWVCNFNFVNRNYKNFCYDSKKVSFNNCVRDVGFSQYCNLNGKCFVVRVIGNSCKFNLVYFLEE